MHPRLLTICLLFLCLASKGQNWFVETTDAARVNHPNHKNWGIAFSDYDRDGDEDIYAFTRLGENTLFQNQGEGHFLNVAPGLGLHYFGSTRAAVWGDINNDGWPDLYIANYQTPDLLFLNLGPAENGQIHFQEISRQAGILNVHEPTSVHMVDVDNDGFLDIYVCNYLAENCLYRNLGNLKFVDITRNAGLRSAGFSMGAIFFDYDNDGDQDAFLLHDFLDPNFLYENDGTGAFRDVAEKAGLNFNIYGMGVDVADINHDGWLDLYCSNLEENRLFLNRGDGGFEDITLASGTGDTGMGWSCVFADIDNDGWVDLYVSNDSHFSAEPNALLRNLGGERFESIAQTEGITSKQGSIGGASADINQDGFADIAIANFAQDEGNQLFQNFGNTHHWISFELEGAQSNRSAIGARIRIQYGEGQQQIDQVTAGSGFASQNALSLSFGLGEVEQVDLIQVFWPSGLIETFRDLAVDQKHHLIENTPSHIKSQQLAALLNAYPNPFDTQLSTQVQVQQSGTIQISLYAMDGRLLQQKETEVESGNISHQWQTEDLPAGMYLIEVQFAGQRISQKLIKLL